jgi:osmoprotectant transport system permease protein
MTLPVVFIASLVGLLAAGSCVAQTLNVGSKRFTESYILGEIIKQAAEAAGEVKAEHRQGLATLRSCSTH